MHTSTGLRWSFALATALLAFGAAAQSTDVANALRKHDPANELVHELGYLRMIQDGNLAGLTDLIDVSINRHLNQFRAMPNDSANVELQCAHLRILSAIKKHWEASPPFRRTAALAARGTSWAQEFMEDYRANREFIDAELSKQSQGNCPT